MTHFTFIFLKNAIVFKIQGSLCWAVWDRTNDLSVLSLLNYQFITCVSSLPKNDDLYYLWEASLVAQMVRCLPTMRETWVWFLGRGRGPLEEEMAIHSSTLAWRVPWMEEHDRLRSMGSQRVGHDWATLLSLSSYFINISPVIAKYFFFLQIIHTPVVGWIISSQNLGLLRNSEIRKR